MLPSKGYFSNFQCPFFDCGSCDRRHCHFKHSKKEKNIHSLEEGKEVSPEKGASLIKHLVTETVKQVLNESDLAKKPEGFTKTVAKDLGSIAEQANITPSYKPTPISELTKRHIPVQYAPTKPVSVIKSRSSIDRNVIALTPKTVTTDRYISSESSSATYSHKPLHSKHLSSSMDLQDTYKPKALIEEPSSSTLSYIPTQIKLDSVVEKGSSDKSENKGTTSHEIHHETCSVPRVVTSEKSDKIYDSEKSVSDIKSSHTIKYKDKDIRSDRDASDITQAVKKVKLDKAILNLVSKSEDEHSVKIYCKPIKDTTIPKSDTDLFSSSSGLCKSDEKKKPSSSNVKQKRRLEDVSISHKEKRNKSDEEDRSDGGISKEEKKQENRPEPRKRHASKSEQTQKGKSLHESSSIKESDSGHSDAVVGSKNVPCILIKDSSSDEESDKDEQVKVEKKMYKLIDDRKKQTKSIVKSSKTKALKITPNIEAKKLAAGESTSLTHSLNPSQEKKRDVLQKIRIEPAVKSNTSKTVSKDSYAETIKIVPGGSASQTHSRHPEKKSEPTAQSDSTKALRKDSYAETVKRDPGGSASRLTEKKGDQLQLTRSIPIDKSSITRTYSSRYKFTKKVLPGGSSALSTQPKLLVKKGVEGQESKNIAPDTAVTTRTYCSRYKLTKMVVPSGSAYSPTRSQLPVKKSDEDQKDKKKSTATDKVDTSMLSKVTYVDAVKKGLGGSPSSSTHPEIPMLCERWRKAREQVQKANLTGKLRISSVPNVSSMLHAKDKILSKAQPLSNLDQPSTSYAVQPTVKQRVAHKPTFLDYPKCGSSVGTSIPVTVRQLCLNSLFETLTQFYLPGEAKEKALEMETDIAARIKLIKTYQNAMALAVLRVRKAEAERETMKDSEENTPPIDAQTIPEYTYGISLYDCFARYKLNKEELLLNGYPRPHRSRKGCAYTHPPARRNVIKQPRDPYHKICINCGKNYFLNDAGFPTTENDCYFHWGRVLRNRDRGVFQDRHKCCLAEVGSEPCQLNRYHVSCSVDEDCMEGFITFQQECPKPQVYALDCEMCFTKIGLELARITMVTLEGKIALDSLVLPTYPILDYCTRFSGITEGMMKTCTTSFEEVREKFSNLIFKNTIIVGHSLENDFKVMKVIHDCVVDTSVVFPHKAGLPYKRALKVLSKEILHISIQESEKGHDSKEDARATLDLMIWKIKEDSKCRKPRVRYSQ